MLSIIKLYKKIPFQIKASVIILIASFITNAISLITTPIFTRLMTVEEYGLVTQYNSVLEVINVIATLYLSAGVFQVAMNEFKDDRDQFTFSALILSNVCTLFVFGIIVFFEKDLSKLLKLPPILFLCMFIYLLFNPAMLMWLSRQRYEYNYKKVAIISILTSFSSLGFAVIAIVLSKNSNLGIVRIWTISIVQSVFAIILYISIAKKSRWKPKWKYMKYAFTFNAPLIIHYLSQYVLRSSDKLMITSFCGEYYTGLYGLGATVASLAIIAWNAMQASLTPYMYSHINTKEYNKVNKSVIAVVSIFSLCCIIVAIVGPEVIYILGSQKYIENIQLVPPIAASSLLSAIYSIYSTIAFYHHKRVSTAVLTVIAAIFNILLNYFLIPKYGYIVAAYTTEVAYLIYTILHFLNYKKIVGENRVFNDKAIWGITSLTTIICLATGIFYNQPVLRYIILCFIILFLVFMRKKIIGVFKNMLKNN